jgi:hypothetical protein
MRAGICKQMMRPAVLSRLTYRHQLHGMNHEQADTYARTTDEDNAVINARSMPRADLVIGMTGS